MAETDDSWAKALINRLNDPRSRAIFERVAEEAREAVNTPEWQEHLRKMREATARDARRG